MLVVITSGTIGLPQCFHPFPVKSSTKPVSVISDTQHSCLFWRSAPHRSSTPPLPSPNTVLGPNHRSNNATGTFFSSSPSAPFPSLPSIHSPPTSESNSHLHPCLSCSLPCSPCHPRHLLHLNFSLHALQPRGTVCASECQSHRPSLLASTIGTLALLWVLDQRLGEGRSGAHFSMWRG